MRRPDGPGHRLAQQPVLARWDRGDDPGQLELVSWLDYAEDLLTEDLADTGPHVLELAVGFPQGRPLIGRGGDLDNYLFPLIHRLGARPFAAAFATKAVGSTSRLLVSPARSEPESLGPPNLSLRATGSYSRPSWPGQIRAACGAAKGLDPDGWGPVRLVLVFTTSHLDRTWSELWKPAIDALTPLVGVDPRARKPAPRDDRITDLSLHHDHDDSLGWDVVIDAWCSLESS